MIDAHGIFAIECSSVLHRIRQLAPFETRERKCDSLVLYLRGGHTYEFGGIRKYAGEGELVYIPSGLTYMNYPSRPDLEYYQIEFRLFDSNGAQITLLDEWSSLAPDRVQDLLTLFRDTYELYAQTKPYARLGCTELLCRIIERVVSIHEGESAKSTERDGMNAVRDHIDRSFRESTSAAELAALASVSVSTLERSFVKLFGATPIMYRNRLRIERAKLLLAGGLNVTEAAIGVGFSDVYYFSRMFKKLCGMTPSEYIRSLG